MFNVNLHSNIIYELSLYSLLIISYFDGSEILLFILLISMIVSMIISGFPNSYLRMGYNISSSRIALDGIFKMLQLILVVEIAHIWGPDKFWILLLILLSISIANLVNRLEVHKQIILENITIESINQIAKTRQHVGDVMLIKNAWQLLILFFLLGLMNPNNLNNIALLLIMFLGEMITLRNLYNRLILSSTNNDVKKRISNRIIKVLNIIWFFSIRNSY
ncbi:hypothetical protein SAMN04488695_11510 [Proteiniclasticum ruminis]|uniref:Uncharacterized protein n=2 Tax=Proteiniclasticum ruminis TaxID=398199 RepID=A0A1I5EBB9_9CLOT|nr:hypothetical protein SAMN04488695_11510 [Proteiniclasticum ruminis]